MAEADYDSQAVPAMTWRQLEIVLQDQAATPVQEAMARHLVDGLRKQARFLTLGGVLREVAIITLAVTDPVGGEASMHLPP
jgi:hypothetical protein